MFSVVLGDVKGLGEGTERGAVPPFSSSQRALSSHPLVVTEIEGFFNLLYAHLLTLWPIDSPETKSRVTSLLPIITSSTTESAAAKYRMYVPPSLSLSVLTRPYPYPPTKSIKPLQHTPTTIRAPSPGLHGTPRARKLKRRAPRAPGLPQRRREMAKGVGYHALREERIPEDPRRRLLKSGPAVRLPRLALAPRLSY